MRFPRSAAAAALAAAATLTTGLLSTPTAQADQNTLPRTDFYDSPSPLPWAPAGTLIRAEPTGDYQVAGRHIPATRMLYHSRTSRGRDVAVSGVVLVPAGKPPEGGWPVVVDAHGTSGIARPCAPSLMRDLYHGNQMTRFLDAGYAVVAPDYAGLGTTGRPEFLNKTAEAEDVVSALRSARQARPALSGRWVTWGHSQGGGAALGVAENQRRDPQAGYLGAVVTSPAADLTAIVSRLATLPGLGGFVPLVVQGAAYSDPRIHPDELLAPPAVARLNLARTGCLDEVMAGYSDLSGSDLVRPGYLADPQLARYLERNTTGRRPVGGPVLLVQGEADSVVPEAATDQVAAQLCHAGSRVDYRTYPGLAHDTYPGQAVGIDDGAMDDILAWTADRFAGRPAGSTC